MKRFLPVLALPLLLSLSFSPAAPALWFYWVYVGSVK